MSKERRAMCPLRTVTAWINWCRPIPPLGDPENWVPLVSSLVGRLEDANYKQLCSVEMNLMKAAVDLAHISEDEHVL